MSITVEAELIYRTKLRREYRVAEIKGKTYYGFTSHPEITKDQYCSIPLLSCNTYGYFAFFKMRPWEIFDKDETYVLTTLAGLLYNNYETIESFEELTEVFFLWVMSWEDTNKKIQARYREHFERFKNMFWVEDKPSMEDLATMAEAKLKKHWFPLEIELIEDPMERRRTKVKIQNQERLEEYRSNFEEGAQEYMAQTLGVLPTAKYQSEATEYSLNIVYTHGRDYFTSNQVYELIQALKILFPGIKQSDMKSELLNYNVKASLPTIKRNWKKVVVPEEAPQPA